MAAGVVVGGVTVSGGSISITDSEGNVLGTEDNPLHTKSPEVTDLLERIFWAIKENTEERKEVLG